LDFKTHLQKLLNSIFLYILKKHHLYTGVNLGNVTDVVNIYVNRVILKQRYRSV